MKEHLEQLLEAGDREAALRFLEEREGEIQTDASLLLEWGKLLYADGRMTDALNRFNAVLRLDAENAVARNYVTMINGILGYFCKDLLNP